MTKVCTYCKNKHANINPEYFSFAAIASSKLDNPVIYFLKLDVVAPHPSVTNQYQTSGAPRHGTPDLRWFTQNKRTTASAWQITWCLHSRSQSLAFTKHTSKSSHNSPALVVCAAASLIKLGPNTLSHTGLFIHIF